MTRLQVLDLPADRLPGEVVAVFFYPDIRPLAGPAALLDWRLNGLLTRQLCAGKGKGDPGEHFLFSGNKKLAAAWVFFAGGGVHKELTPLTLSGSIGSVLEVTNKAGFRRVALALDVMEGMSVHDAERAVWDNLDKDRFRDMEVILACRGPRG
jgi:hypothetical protein